MTSLPSSGNEVALRALLRCKNYLTRKGLYYEPYKHLAHWSDGKLRPSLKQSATTSRRFAPAGPNVNQIPKRSEEGKKVRRCIIPHCEDAVIISPDFSGQELRLGAEASGDSAFLSCYLGNSLKDLHSLTGFAIGQKQGAHFTDYEEFVAAVADGDKAAKKSRGLGKNTNFLSQYGGTSYTLSKKLQLPETLTQEMLDAKAGAYPGVEIWKEEYSKECSKTQLSRTFMGGIKHLHELIKRGGGAHVLRSALNFRIQSSAGEVTKLAMARIWDAGPV